MVKIFIDPGHGGRDPGATGNGLQEKDLTLTLGNLTAKYLEEYENVSIKLSRTTDKTLSLDQRTDAANRWGADFLVSIHINAGGGTGYEDYIYNGLKNASSTAKAREIIHNKVSKAVGMPNRGAKKANFHMLRESKMKAVLTENGFIDSKSDARKMKSSKWLHAVARAHAEGIAKVYGLKKKAKKEESKEGVYYRVVTGSFKDKQNAEDRVAALKKKGFDSFIDVYNK